MSAGDETALPPPDFSRPVVAAWVMAESSC